MTWLPSARIKSGLSGLMPSAMYATFTPVPSTSCWAVFAFGSSEAVFVSAKASGSRSGLAGSVGQTALLVGFGSARGRTPEATDDEPAVSGTGTWILTLGTTAATAGSAANAAAWAAVTVRDTAFAAA